MHAIVRHEYGSPDVLRFEDVDIPSIRSDEVLVRVIAASVNPGDAHLLRADPFIVRLMGTGVFRPKCEILGADVAGRVEAVGDEVTQFRVGDDVFGGDSSMSAHYGGGFAEFVAVKEAYLAKKPTNISFEEAAAVPVAALAALQGLRDKGRIQEGHRVLINGASGGVGTFAVQLAKLMGANVTGVCSAPNVEMVFALGADHVIDYEKVDFTKLGRKYDRILDTAAHRSPADYRRALADEGIYVMVGGSTARMFQLLAVGPWTALTSHQKMVLLNSHPSKEDLVYLRDLLAAGQLTAVIDRRFDLEDVPEAIRYLEKAHTRGKVIIHV